MGPGRKLSHCEWESHGLSVAWVVSRMGVHTVAEGRTADFGHVDTRSKNVGVIKRVHESP